MSTKLPAYCYGRSPEEFLDRLRAERATCQRCHFEIRTDEKNCCLLGLAGYPRRTAHDCDQWRPRARPRRGDVV